MKTGSPYSFRNGRTFFLCLKDMSPWEYGPPVPVSHGCRRVKGRAPHGWGKGGPERPIPAYPVGLATRTRPPCFILAKILKISPFYNLYKYGNSLQLHSTLKSKNFSTQVLSTSNSFALVSRFDFTSRYRKFQECQVLVTKEKVLQ